VFRKLTLFSVGFSYPVFTCRMGDAEDTEGALEAALRGNFI
jgi:hypothetical protein